MLHRPHLIPQLDALRTPEHGQLRRMRAQALALAQQRRERHVLPQLLDAVGRRRANQLAGTGPVVLADLLRALHDPQQPRQAAAEAAAAEQQGRAVLRTPEQQLARRLWFHLLRTLAALCRVPAERLMQRAVGVLSRRQVLGGRSLTWWCRELERQAQLTLGHERWWEGVLDHRLCLALADLPDELEVVMAMANLLLMSW